MKRLRETNKDERWTLQQAVWYLMKEHGMTRRQARRTITRAIESGALPIYGTNEETGVIERIEVKNIRRGQ